MEQQTAVSCRGQQKRVIKAKLEKEEVLELLKLQDRLLGEFVRPIGATETDFKNALGYFGLGALTSA